MDEAHAGDIVMVAGLSDIGIGDTIVDPANPNVSQLGTAYLQFWLYIVC